MPTDEYLASVASHIRERAPLQRTYTQIASVADCQRRQVPEVAEPAWYRPSDEQFFSFEKGRRVPNAAFLKDFFAREGRLTQEQALYILREATNLLSTEDNLLRVGGPITVCGDIHGQYYDFMKLLEIGGDPASNTYLFLGDYVDRGWFGIECLLYLYTLKICFPDKIYLLRGNHECRHLTEYFTFQRECVRKYSPEVYSESLRSFCALPLAAVLDDRFLCVHGGLSPELNVLSDINNINRFQEPPSYGLLCDLLWSDPIPNFGHEQDGAPASTSSSVAGGAVGAVPPGTTFKHNPARGCSFLFTYEAACNFLERNNLLGIIRGHEAQQAGYAMYRKTPMKKFPSVITIFSAPNYCDVYRNRAAVLKYVNRNITIRQFNSTAHPYWLPNFMDAFTWSLPFVGDKIVQMLLAILSICTAEELEESASSEDEGVRVEDEAVTTRRQEMRNKIMAVGRMRRVFQLLREESETASELSAAMEAAGMSAVRSRQGSDALGEQSNQIRRQIRNFEDARRHDIYNERLPDIPPTPLVHPPSGASTPGSTPSSAIAFPQVQAPSTRWRRTADDLDMEAALRRTLSGEGADDEDEELRALAERVARTRHHHHGSRPAALKRHETV